jgi:thiol-disulfide isomerase/thioredoxin
MLCHSRWKLAILVLTLLATSFTASAQSGAANPAHKSSASAASPNLPLIDLASYNQILAKYRGKPMLMTFWATWCEPCRTEYPMIVDLAKQYAPRGLQVVGVSLDDDSGLNLVRHFLAKYQPSFPNFRQKPGIDVDGFYRGVNPMWQGTMPETVFYTKDGQIAGSFAGAGTREMFEQAIGIILAAHSAQQFGVAHSQAGQ